MKKIKLIVHTWVPSYKAQKRNELQDLMLISLLPNIIWPDVYRCSINLLFCIWMKRINFFYKITAWIEIQAWLIWFRTVDFFNFCQICPNLYRCPINLILFIDEITLIYTKETVWIVKKKKKNTINLVLQIWFVLKSSWMQFLPLDKKNLKKGKIKLHYHFFWI